jgi:hypothetical protein
VLSLVAALRGRAVSGMLGRDAASSMASMLNCVRCGN